MFTRTKALAASLALGAALVFAPMTPVAAQSLVDVKIGNVTILEDVDVAVALNLVAQICGTTVQALQIDLSSGDNTATCTAGGRGQTVTITQ